MKRNSKLSVALHSLLHIARNEKGSMTSEQLGECIDTNPVVIRRILGELRKVRLVQSEKGHGGGWSLAKKPKDITLLDVYVAIGEKFLPQVKAPDKNEKCLIVHSISSTMMDFVEDAKSLLESRLRRVSLKDFIKNIEDQLSEDKK